MLRLRSQRCLYPGKMKKNQNWACHFGLSATKHSPSGPTTLVVDPKYTLISPGLRPIITGEKRWDNFIYVR